MRGKTIKTTTNQTQRSDQPNGITFTNTLLSSQTTHTTPANQPPPGEPAPPGQLLKLTPPRPDRQTEVRPDLTRTSDPATVEPHQRLFAWDSRSARPSRSGSLPRVTRTLRHGERCGKSLQLQRFGDPSRSSGCVPRRRRRASSACVTPSRPPTASPAAAGAARR